MAYRLAKMFHTALGLVLIGLYFLLEPRIGRWEAAGMVLGIFVVTTIALPTRRKLARAALARGMCPACGSALRKYDQGLCTFYCRSCEIGFTERGKQIDGEDG